MLNREVEKSPLIIAWQKIYQWNMNVLCFTVLCGEIGMNRFQWGVYICIQCILHMGCSPNPKWLTFCSHPFCFSSFWAKPKGYQNGCDSNINCEKYRCINLFNRVRSTTFSQDHPHKILWMGFTNQIIPDTLNKAHDQLRHVWWSSADACSLIWPKNSCHTWHNI